MMRRIWIVAVLAILCSCASSGSSSGGSSGPVDLDTAIQQASREITDSLTRGTKVAILNFSSESDVFTDFVLEEMSIALVNGKGLTVVDRKEIELIRGEMNFQMSGDVSDESAQAIGMMLGAQSIISGSLVSMGDTYRFRTKAINVISAAIETSSSISVKSDSQIQYLLTQGRRTSPATAVAQGGAQSNTQVQPTPAQAQPQPATPAGPALPSYRIGDAGPAGGLIFYDKGNNSGGWRYLEAAPEEVEFQAIWSVHNTAVENTRAEIGRGTQNTRLIVEKLRQTSGEWDTAAQKANDLVFNGFDDWFLPSKDELDQMYGNLKRRNLGEFRDEWYWSSTENPSADWRGYAWAQSFKDGRMYHQVQKLNNRLYVRAIRQVPGQ